MKTIAKINGSRVLVEMTSQEIAIILGKSYLSSDDEKKYLNPGEEFSLAERYENLIRLHSLPSKLKGLREETEKMLTAIEASEKLVDTTTFTYLKD